MGARTSWLPQAKNLSKLLCVLAQAMEDRGCVLSDMSEWLDAAGGEEEDEEEDLNDADQRPPHAQSELMRNSLIAPPLLPLPSPRSPKHPRQRGGARSASIFTSFSPTDRLPVVVPGDNNVLIPLAPASAPGTPTGSSGGNKTSLARQRMSMFHEPASR